LQRSKPTADAATGCLLRFFKQQQSSSEETAPRVHLITKATAANPKTHQILLRHPPSSSIIKAIEHFKKLRIVKNNCCNYQGDFLVRKKNRGISKGEEGEEFPHNPTSTRPKHQLLVYPSKENISKTLVLLEGFWQGKERSN
jgi:hypothetical protein